MRKHSVHYEMPGTLFAEETSRSIDSWDVDKAVEMAPTKGPYGPGAYCFYFVTYVTAEPIPDGEGGTLKVQPREVKRSGKYFLGGTVMDRERVIAWEKQKGGYSAASGNMRGNGWKYLILTRFGNMQPFEKGDTLLEAKVGSQK